MAGHVARVQRRRARQAGPERAPASTPPPSAPPRLAASTERRHERGEHDAGAGGSRGSGGHWPSRAAGGGAERRAVSDHRVETQREAQEDAAEEAPGTRVRAPVQPVAGQREDHDRGRELQPEPGVAIEVATAPSRSRSVLMGWASLVGDGPGLGAEPRAHRSLVRKSAERRPAGRAGGRRLSAIGANSLRSALPRRQRSAVLSPPRRAGLDSRPEKRQPRRFALERTLVLLKPDAVQRGLIGAHPRPLRGQGPEARRPEAAPVPERADRAALRGPQGAPVLRKAWSSS